jgi:VanZ family protein
MAARDETAGRTTHALDDAMIGNAATSKQHNRLWRYAPLVAWMSLVLFASTGTMSAANTSRIIEPLLHWLFPRISESSVATIHFAVRKCAHFTEYAILSLFAARAFLPSSKVFLRRHWLVSALMLVICVSLADEFNQSFNPARTGTIRDSALDTFGGACTLIALNAVRAKRRRESFVKT